MSASRDVGPDILCTTGQAKRLIRRWGVILAMVVASLASKATLSYGLQVRSLDRGQPTPVAQAATYDRADSVPPAMLELGLRVAAPPPMPPGLSERQLWLAHETAAFLAGDDEPGAMQAWRTLVLSARGDGVLRGRSDVEATSLWILREAFVEPNVEIRWIADVLLTNSVREMAARDRLEVMGAESDRDRDSSASLLLEEYLKAAVSASDGAAADLTRALDKRDDVTGSIVHYYSMMNTYDPEVRFTD